MVEMLSGEMCIRDRVHAMGSVSHALADGLDGEGLLKAVLKDFELEILEKHPVEYRCYCSRDQVDVYKRQGLRRPGHRPVRPADSHPLSPRFPSRGG